jgi:hypothetical protein
MKQYSLKPMVNAFLSSAGDFGVLIKEITKIKIAPNYLPYLNTQEQVVLKDCLDMVSKKPRKNEKQKLDKRILLIPSYYFGSLTLIIDLLFIIHLKKQGATVVIVSPTSLFKNQDPLFGGNYNKYRKLRMYFHILIEKRVAKISQSEFVKLNENLSALDKSENLDKLSSEELRDYRFQGYALGEHAWKTAVNMRDGHFDPNKKNFKLEILHHIHNQVSYVKSIETFFRNNEAFSILSNSAFYYRWAIPHLIFNSKGIKTYSYILSEKMNSIFVTSKHEPILSLDTEDVEQLLKNFRDSLQIEFKVVGNSYHQLRSGLDYSNVAVSRLSSGKIPATLEVLKHANWKKRILIPCNVAFDAAVLQGSSAFRSYEEFLSYCMELSTNFPDCFFIFKIHPGERLFKRKVLSSLEILQKYNVDNANNVLVIDSGVQILARDIIEPSDMIIAYSSSMALEAAMLGKVVVTCSDIHYQALQFTQAVISKQELFSRVEDLISGDSREQSKIAELSTLYAIYHFGVAQIDLGIFKNSNPDLEGRILPTIDTLAILNNQALEEVTLRILNREPIHTLTSKLKPSGIAESIFSKVRSERST